MGFENGFTSWNLFLKNDGFIVVIDVSRLERNPPKELRSDCIFKPEPQDIDFYRKYSDYYGYVFMG